MKGKKLMAVMLAALIFVLNIAAAITEIKAQEVSVKGTFNSNDCIITYTVVGMWDKAYNVNVNIYNNSDKTIDDWVMELFLDGEIINIWNAEIICNKEKEYVIKNAVWNQDVKPAQSIDIGFTVKSDNVILPDSINIVSEKSSVDRKNYKFEYVEISNWISGYNSQIKITNCGTYTVEDWVIELDCENIVAGLYGGLIIEQTGNHYVIKNVEYNQNISPGQSIIIGMLGSGVDKGIQCNRVTLYSYGYTRGEFVPDNGQEKDNTLDRDPDADDDNDGISNAQEDIFKTNPDNPDSDFDGLNDYEEIYIYNTNPTNSDSDGDGASDSWELNHGCNPLEYNASFNMSCSYGEVCEATPVAAKVEVEATDVDVNSLKINRVNAYDNPFITPSIAGYLGDAYDFSINGNFNYADITFEYDTLLGKLSDSFQPRIYYFNDENKMFEKLQDQKIEEGKVTARTSHFSTYVLLNEVDFDAVWKADIKPESQYTEHDTLNVIFTVDLSDSMYGNNKLNVSRDSIRTFVNALDENDMAGLVTFTNQASQQCTLTTDKEQLLKRLSVMSEDGYLTAISVGLKASLQLYSFYPNIHGKKIIVLITGGYDEPSRPYEEYYKPLVEQAKKAGIAIYSLGIETIDKKLLKKISDETGGKYYEVTTTEEISASMDAIREEYIKKNKDSNKDGISDYYTELIKNGQIVLSNGSKQFANIDLNYNQSGELSADYDGDGLLNGEEIEIIDDGTVPYIVMHSNPLLQHSDGDGINDCEEVRRGSDPMIYSYDSAAIDYLLDDKFYNHANVAKELRDNPAIGALNNYSALIFNVWGRTDIYEDVLVDYYCTYVTADSIDAQKNNEEKRLWIDVLNQYLANLQQAADNGIDVYREIKNINLVIDAVNGADNKKLLDMNFYNRVSELIVSINNISEDATKIRSEVNGNQYIVRYLDISEVRKLVGTGLDKVDKVTDAMPYVGYGLDVVDTIADAAMIHANQRAIQDNLDALDYIINNDSDTYMRTAASSVRNQVVGNYINKTLECIKEAVGMAIISYIKKLAENNVYYVIATAIRDIFDIVTGISEDVRQEFRINTYYSIASAYGSLLVPLKEKHNKKGYYQENLMDKQKMYARYLTNIVQSRILGEQEYYYFVKSDGFYIFRDFFDVMKNTEEYRQNVNASVSNVIQRAQKLNIKISDNINTIV